MTHHIAIQAALEWYRASGPRTADRLNGLVEHFCTVNGITDPVRIAAMQADARQEG